MNKTALFFLLVIHFFLRGCTTAELAAGGILGGASYLAMQDSPRYEKPAAAEKPPAKEPNTYAKANSAPASPPATQQKPAYSVPEANAHSPGMPDDSPARARTLVSQGIDFYQKGKYAQAYAALRQIQLSGLPVSDQIRIYLYLAANALLLGHSADARFWMETAWQKYSYVDLSPVFDDFPTWLGNELKAMLPKP
ncbi:MAG: hypothetical protein AB1656_24625 [Candidatus Omnitrophota bacterium]